MQILVTNGSNFYEEFTLQAFSVYFMNTLRPAKETYADDAENGENKTHEGEIKPNLLLHFWCCC
jgi:hypothetical protein